MGTNELQCEKNGIYNGIRIPERIEKTFKFLYAPSIYLVFIDIRKEKKETFFGTYAYKIANKKNLILLFINAVR